MSFVLRAGEVFGRPSPAFKGLGPGCWEYDCGWCGIAYPDAAQLVAHVKRERERGTHQSR